MSTRAHQEFDTTRIPVDSAVLFRTSGMDDFELCHVMNVSTTSMEVLFAHTLPLNTLITFAIGGESSSSNFYKASGEVLHREPMGDDWLHVISAVRESDSWPSSFLFDVVCSSADESDDLIESFRSIEQAGVQASPAPIKELMV